MVTLLVGGAATRHLSVHRLASKQRSEIYLKKSSKRPQYNIHECSCSKTKLGKSWVAPIKGRVWWMAWVLALTSRGALGFPPSRPVLCPLSVLHPQSTVSHPGWLIDQGLGQEGSRTCRWVQGELPGPHPRQREGERENEKFHLSLA